VRDLQPFVQNETLKLYSLDLLPHTMPAQLLMLLKDSKDAIYVPNLLHWADSHFPKLTTIGDYLNSKVLLWQLCGFLNLNWPRFCCLNLI